MMWAVHFLSKKIPPGEYGNFGALLAVVMVAVPTIPLQMVMAQQTAAAVARNRLGELSGVIRMFWGATLALWLAGSVVVLLLQGQIMAAWKLDNPAGLYITLAILLVSCWVPMLQGALQGAQSFLWLGWSLLSNGVVRFAAAAVAVLVLHSYSTGMMVGVLLGTLTAFALAAWSSRSLWRARPEPFDRANLARQVIPLVLAFLGFQILFTADTIFVKAYFPEATAGFYVAAGTLSRALMWLVLPLATVMFPRLVHSAVRSEESNLFGLVLAGTALLAAVGGACLWLVGPWVVSFVYTDRFLDVVISLLPWYAFAMVPLAVANVLLNNLLARPAAQLGAGAAILTLALGYMVALSRFHDSLVMVLQTMGVFNLLLLGVCAYFTWTGSRLPDHAAHAVGADR